MTNEDEVTRMVEQVKPTLASVELLVDNAGAPSPVVPSQADGGLRQLFRPS